MKKTLKVIFVALIIISILYVATIKIFSNRLDIEYIKLEEEINRESIYNSTRFNIFGIKSYEDPKIYIFDVKSSIDKIEDGYAENTIFDLSYNDFEGNWKEESSYNYLETISNHEEIILNNSRRYMIVVEQFGYSQYTSKFNGNQGIYNISMEENILIDAVEYSILTTYDNGEKISEEIIYDCIEMEIIDKELIKIDSIKKYIPFSLGYINEQNPIFIGISMYIEISITDLYGYEFSAYVKVTELYFDPNISEYLLTPSYEDHDSDNIDDLDEFDIQNTISIAYGLGDITGYSISFKYDINIMNYFAASSEIHTKILE